MKKQKPNSHWKDNYSEVRAEAQKKANEYGYDYGVEKDFFGYRCFMLPEKKNRYGHEIYCEVVHPENLEKCKPGHGPLAEGRPDSYRDFHGWTPRPRPRGPS